MTNMVGLVAALTGAVVVVVVGEYCDSERHCIHEPGPDPDIIPPAWTFPGHFPACYHRSSQGCSGCTCTPMARKHVFGEGNHGGKL